MAREEAHQSPLKVSKSRQYQFLFRHYADGICNVASPPPSLPPPPPPPTSPLLSHTAHFQCEFFWAVVIVLAIVVVGVHRSHHGSMLDHTRLRRFIPFGSCATRDPICWANCCLNNTKYNKTAYLRNFTNSHQIPFMSDWISFVRIPNR